MRNSMAVLVAVAGVAIASSTTAAQGKQPMAVEDLLAAIRVGDPQVSPDGLRVLFARTTTDLATGKRNADIWVVPSDGSAPPRSFIASPKGDDTPRFLRDGRVAFFDSKRWHETVFGWMTKYLAPLTP
ncbi:hypothetical protein BH09GEM1_BH09GEM1_47050 [soil metagenome]